MSLSLTIPDDTPEPDARAMLATSAVVQGSLALMRVCDGLFGPLEADSVVAASRAAVRRFRARDTTDHHEILLMMASVSGSANLQLIADAMAAKNAAIKCRAAGKHADADAYMRDAESMTRQASQVAAVVNLAISRSNAIRKGPGAGTFKLIDQRVITKNVAPARSVDEAE